MDTLTELRNTAARWRKRRIPEVGSSRRKCFSVLSANRFPSPGASLAVRSRQLDGDDVHLELAEPAMDMYMYIYIYIYICIHIHMCIYIYIYMCIHILRFAEVSALVTADLADQNWPRARSAEQDSGRFGGSTRAASYS